MTRYEEPLQGINLAPCQVCRQLKNKFYICDQNHTTCEDCKEVREKTLPQPAAVSNSRASPTGRRVKFSLPLTPESPRTNSERFPEQSSNNRLSPSSAASRTNRESLSPSGVSSRRSRSPSNDPPSIFSYRSPIKSLVTIPKPDRVIREEAARESNDFLSGETALAVESRASRSRDMPSPPQIVEEDCSDGVEIFCRGCDDFVEVIPVTLPKSVIECSATQFLDSAENEEVEEFSVEQDEWEDDTAILVPTTSFEPSDGEDLKKHIQKLRDGIITTYSELMNARSDLDEVMYAQEKLEMDVDMLRGGVNYVYFNFDSILKRPEVRQVERICGIPFVLMVRLRNVDRVPHVGFFVGLEPYEGRAHSPLKKTIVFRAHNAYGKVIEKHTLQTFEDGQCAHPCFDLTERQDGGMYGYSNFLRKDRILKPDMLKDGRLCLSLQIKALP